MGQISSKYSAYEIFISLVARPSSCTSSFAVTHDRSSCKNQHRTTNYCTLLSNKVTPAAVPNMTLIFSLRIYLFHR